MGSGKLYEMLKKRTFSEKGGFEWYPDVNLPVIGPVTGLGVGTQGTWVEVVAAAFLPDPCWIVGAYVEAINIDEYVLEFGTGILGLEVELDPDVEPYLNAAAVGDSVHYLGAWIPRRIDGQPRLAVRVKNLGAPGSGVFVRVAIGRSY